MDEIKKMQTNGVISAQQRRRRWVSVFLCLAVVATLGTLAVLKLTGVAMTQKEKVLDCHFTGLAAHTHNDDCYDVNGMLVCPLEERPLHTHDESCYTTESFLVCGQEESEGHQHTDACYSTVRGDLICGEEENEEHTHTDDCYDWYSELTCGMAEGEGAHWHSDDCYETTTTLSCGLEELTEEHTHGSECFVTMDAAEAEYMREAAREESGDPDADVETAADWDAMIDALDLTGDWNEDLVTVAQSQLGYTESAANFILNDDGEQKGYTRYGAWYGVPYGDWCAMFASFCLEYTGIPEEDMPQEAGVERWIEKLDEMDLYASASGDYSPKTGDLLFLDLNDIDGADHVGIIETINTDEITVIEGNSGNAVREVTYALDSNQIAGYGILPEEPVETAEAQPNDYMPAQVFEAWADNVFVSVYAPEGAFPMDTVMTVTPIYDDDVIAAATGAVEGDVTTVEAVDITFTYQGEEIEPLVPIEVRMTSDTVDPNAEIVHIDNDGEANVVGASSIVEDQIVFESDAFSTYVIVGKTIEKSVLTSDGRSYKVSVTYGPDAGIPDGAELEVVEITEDDDASASDYADYINRAAVLMDAATFAYAKVLDISIVDSEGGELQPLTPVNVSIELLDAENKEEEFAVLHFGDEEAAPQDMQAESEENTVAFSTDGFSAYAIVQGPVGIPVGWTKITTLSELREKASEGLYIGTTSGFYLKNTQANNSKTSDPATGIEKTKPAQSYPASSAARYYFEAVDPAGSDAQFYIYCLGDQGEKKYVKNDGTQNVSLVAEADRTAFTVLVDNNGNFRFQNGGRYWNMWNGNGGNIIAAWTSATDANNYFNIWEYNTIESDPYGVDGRAYGLMFWDEGISGKALMSENGRNANTLAAKELTVMAKQDDNSEKLFVPNDSDVSMWTFEWLRQNQFYVKTVSDGRTKYLSVSAAGLTLVNEPNETCEIQLVPGMGTHAGEICLKAGDKTLTYSGKKDDGFNTRGSTGNEWLHLVELSELTKDYVMTYTAEKVSVSDLEQVENGSHVIVYTRSWNEQTKKYEFYAIDHDGTLVRCYESGDDIRWVEGRINTILWNFVEYTNEDGTPSYYYELYNQYSEKYIAPQMTGGQTLSDNVIGINMNGRRNGRYYSPIIAWDEGHYSYVGLKVENGRIVSCPIEEAVDFYFAVMHDIPADDTLTTLPTVDHTQNGITMRIVDFDTRKEMSDFLGNDDYTNGKTTAGLLSTNLGDDGYPVAAGGSLSQWFGSAREVNHLFIASTYYGSGYYEYDSTKNFAHLNEDGNFTVYRELGTMDSGSVSKFYTHGQFMPFNDIQAGVFASNNRQNATTATGAALPDDDPRLFERLYLVKNPNYFNGVELEASFIQTPGGVDDWGHDIIYEFTGDDDFWLYVDGELIIDLGGIHDALPGSVNYRTGTVMVNGAQTTLRALFENNYRGRNPGASDAEVADYLAQYFEGESTIFKDYTTHTMKIFYLERGAGASNLNMRFNLSSIKPGTVELSKTLGGVDSTESILTKFPYQIWYKTTEEGEEQLLAENDPLEIKVSYKNTTTAVTHMDSLTVDGAVYDSVYLLSPGETAVIDLPDDAILYRIVECGVDTEVFSSVSVNGASLSGSDAAGAANRKDYGIDYASSEERARVSYVNTVDPDALRTLSFTKKLFKEDGTTAIGNDADATTFSFRLYLGTEFDSTLSPADMHTYHVRDASGNYCIWDIDEKRMTSLGKDDYSTLTAEEKVAATFHTSMNGAISKIPVDYTVEVREVLAGTTFRVQERPWEIPDGYSFQKYDYDNADYSGNTTDAETGVTDTVVSGRDPHVDICNLKGWGLRVNKVWSDKDYMSSRDAVYFAVYTSDAGGGTEALTYVDGTLRKMPYNVNSQTLYWYFRILPVAGKTLSQYEIREVEITGGDPIIGEDGTVTNADSLSFTPIAHEGKIELSGIQKGETGRSGVTYDVLYAKGETTADSNVRVDTVTNNRPGIVLKKTDWSGAPLAGATFTLVDNEGDLIGSFTSDSEGQITVAFLRDNVDYTLTETKAPQGYYGLQAPMIIRLSNGEVSVSGIDAQWYTVDRSGTPTLTIRNRPYVFTAVKVDGDTEAAMSGVTFELHRQVTVDGVTTVDVEPMLGYEALITDSDGVIQKLDNTLPAGTYELREKTTPGGYQTLSGYIPFTVDQTGKLTLGDKAPDEVTLTEDGESGENLTYTMTVRNYINGQLTIKKVKEDGAGLAGAKFQLCKYTTAWEVVSEYSEIDMTSMSETQLEKLTVGRYRLAETFAPKGYVVMDKYVYFNVAPDGSIALTDEEGTGQNSSIYVSLNEKTLTIKNVTGSALPRTGGVGAGIYTVTGLMLVVASALALGAAAAQRKRRSGEGA